MITIPPAETAATGNLSSAPSVLRNRYSGLVLLAGLLLTTAATLYVKSSVERSATREFDTQCNDIQHKIIERLVDHARLLLSGAALFNASERVTRRQWHDFTQSQKVEQQLPGIQGIGFSVLIPQAELARHVRAIRQEGFPEYRLKPAGGFSSTAYLSVWLTAAGGAGITFLLFFLIRAVLNTQANARRIAEKLTLDLLESEQFSTNIMDSLSSTIAVLDAQGIIIAVNESWRNFAVENDSSGAKTSDVGKQYLNAIRESSDGEGDDGAEAALTGIRAVLLPCPAYFFGIYSAC